MKIIFAGTPEFSASILRALLASQHDILAVYTQPDRPAGRGRHVSASAVKILACEHKIPVYQPTTLKEASAQAVLASFQADIMVVVAYGLLLPPAVLALPRYGCVNVHASLLPRWRGAAPIQRAIEAGDTETGVTIMQMDAGLDTGNCLLKRAIPICHTDTSESLFSALATLGAQALLEALSQWNQLVPAIQDSSLATYAKKIAKEEGRIDWSLAAEIIHRKIRAFSPWPVAYCDAFRIWRATVCSYEGNAQPGVIVHVSSEGLTIATGRGALCVQEVQCAGGVRMAVRELLHAKSQLFCVGARI